MNLRYAIIGTGAVGGLYGARLHHAGRDVHFLLRSDFEHVREHGLRVESVWGNLLLNDVRIHGSPSDLPPCDVVCVCLKSNLNPRLPDLLKHCVRPGALILLLQNGLGAEDEVAASYPQAAVAGGLCFLCSNKVGPGHIRHLDHGKVVLGAHSPTAEPILSRVAADFAAAGIPCELSGPLPLLRWKKLVWNIPYNGLSVALHAETDELMAHPASRRLVEDLMDEVRAGAAACGHPIGCDFVTQMLETTATMKPYRTSMMLDFVEKRPLEIEYIYRRPLAAARKAGIDLPAISVLTAELEFLDARNRNDVSLEECGARNREGLP